MIESLHDEPRPSAAGAPPAGHGPLRRAPFPGPSVPGATALLRMLVGQDGSTTRSCEALVGAPVQVRLQSQHVTSDVPAPVRPWVPGVQVIERVTSLTVDGEVLTDNLVYVALDGLDPALRESLQSGRVPIGHLVAERWLRRDNIDADAAVLDRLWARVGEPDPVAVRCYFMHSPDGLRMLICEAFRHGLWARAVAARGPVSPPASPAP